MVDYQRGEDLVRISMNLPREVWKRLKIRAAEDELTAIEILVKLLEKHLSEKVSKRKKCADGLCSEISWSMGSRYRDLNGRRKIEKVSSKVEGNDKLVEIQRALRQRTYDPGRAKMLLKDFAVDWLQVRRAEIKTSTLRVTSTRYGFTSCRS